MKAKTSFNKQGGFGHIELLIIIVLAAILGLVAWRVFANQSHQHSNGSPAGSFYVSGNKVIGPSGKQFVPYGVVVECAALKEPVNTLCNGTDFTGNSGSAEISAAAKYWNMNIIRFQVAQENLFNSDGSVNNTYLNLIDSMVKQANSLGMVATITLQEEEYNGPAFPTATATTFWKFMANHYKNNPDVFFDLYNEPRLPANAIPSGSSVWAIWQNGGTAYMSTGTKDVSKKTIQYVGMQSLVNTIRGEGSKNIIIAEGPNYDKDLSGIPTHQLTGGNIAYGVEPNLRINITPKAEYKNFGQYTKTWPIMPEAFLDNVGTHSCDPNSPVDLPKLLTYLKSLDMGLIFWSLDPGVGIVGHNLTEPTSYPTGSNSIGSSLCPYKGSKSKDIPTTNTVGDGSLIRSYYKSNSIQL